jgi:hypothetical protein
MNKGNIAEPEGDIPTASLEAFFKDQNMRVSTKEQNLPTNTLSLVAKNQPNHTDPASLAMDIFGAEAERNGLRRSYKTSDGPDEHRVNITFEFDRGNTDGLYKSMLHPNNMNDKGVPMAQLNIAKPNEGAYVRNWDCFKGSLMIRGIGLPDQISGSTRIPIKGGKGRKGGKGGKGRQGQPETCAYSSGPGTDLPHLPPG